MCIYDPVPPLCYFPLRSDNPCVVINYCTRPNSSRIVLQLQLLSVGRLTQINMEGAPSVTSSFNPSEAFYDVVTGKHQRWLL